jgi:hypothetical protein
MVTNYNFSDSIISFVEKQPTVFEYFIQLTGFRFQLIYGKFPVTRSIFHEFR